MRMLRKRALRLLAGAGMGGVCFQFGGCLQPGAVASFAGNFNPCLTVLLCDPIEYRFLTSGYQGPGVDPAIDPACTFPPFCVNDPFVNGGFLP